MSLNTTDVLPSELWEPIFRAACTDGGTTGRSLALVSKRMQCLSEPYQLQSIAINNLDEAMGFISRLEASSPRARSGVRCLYFSNNMMSTASLYKDEERNTIQSAMDFISDKWFIIKDERWWKLKMEGKQTATLLQRRRISKRIHWQMNHIVPAFFKVLHMVSPSLRSLTVDITSRNHAYPHSDLKLPILPLLTSFAIGENSIFQINAYRTLICPSSLTSITYLDLVHIDRRFVWEGFVIKVIKHFGPSLRFVRINMDWTTGYLFGAEHSNVEGTFKVELPGWLRIVFLQLRDLQWVFQQSPFWKLLPVVDHRFVILHPAHKETSIEDLATRYDVIES